MDQEKIESIRNKYGVPVHYHGDRVRTFFVLGSLIMLLALPFLSHRLPTSPFISIVIIILLGSAAGFLSPRNKWVIFSDFIISLLGLFVFEYYAVQAYNTTYSIEDALFLTNQILAIVFLFALYYSAKTFRSGFVGK